MTVKGLYTETRSHIPNAQRAIGATTDEEISKWLPHKSVDAICVTAELLSQLDSMKVEKFYCTIGGTGKHKVTRIMEFSLP
jgi:hypothetical protein